MNRLAALIDRLTTAGDEARQRLLADYFATIADPDRTIAANLLAGTRTWHRARLPFVRGVAEARLDPTLFALSADHVGDLGETIALLWPARAGANRDPSLSKIAEGLSSLGKSELPKRIESWLDALDANGRWLLIKLVTGGFRSPVAPADVGHALTAIGAECGEQQQLASPAHQQDMFGAPRSASTPGAVKAALLYVEFGRNRTIGCTFGLWHGGTLVPAAKVALDPVSQTWRDIEPLARHHTIARFGPVREIAHTRDRGIVLELAFAGIDRTPRRKAGIALVGPRIEQLLHGAMPDRADAIETLEAFLRR
jgi:ATP-dependent DNA ligase